MICPEPDVGPPRMPRVIPVHAEANSTSVSSYPVFGRGQGERMGDRVQAGERGGHGFDGI